MTPAQKGQRTKRRNAEAKAEAAVFHLAYDLVLAIEAMPDDPEAECIAVAQAFRDAKGTTEQKFEAFRQMDEKPGQFPHYLRGNWYARLRRTRNQHYTALVAGIKGTP